MGLKHMYSTQWKVCGVDFDSGGLPALAGFRCAAEEPAVVDVAALYYAGAINVEVNWWGSHATEHTLHATPLLKLCRQIEVAGND